MMSSPPHCDALLVVDWGAHLVEFCSVIADAGQSELSLGLNEPHGYPLRLEWQKLQGHSGYFRR